MGNTLCMLVANSDKPTWVRESLRSAILNLNPEEYIFSPARVRDRELVEELIHDYLENRGVKIQILEGTDERLLMGYYRFLQFDKASMDDPGGWIINMDDDDNITGKIDLSRASNKAGIFHTGILTVCVTDMPNHGYCRDDIFTRQTKRMHNRMDAPEFKGSLWGVRKHCWKKLSPIVCRQTVSEDWDLGYHAMRLGWEDYFIPISLQIQRAKQFVPDPRSIEKNWRDHLTKLERWFYSQKQYWSEWDKPSLEPDWKGWSAKNINFAKRYWYGGHDVEACKQHVQQIYNTVLNNIPNQHIKTTHEPKTYDDIFSSSNRTYPVVLAKGIFPHIPQDHVAKVLHALWGMTEKVLIIQWLGVDRFDHSTEHYIDGKTWYRPTMQAFKQHVQSAISCQRLDVHQDKELESAILVAWK